MTHLRINLKTISVNLGPGVVSYTYRYYASNFYRCFLFDYKKPTKPADCPPAFCIIAYRKHFISFM